MAVTPAIPASQIVQVNPSVLSAGGDALDLVGIMLTDDARVPYGQVLSFPTTRDTSRYFGSLSQMAALGTIYFLGFDNSSRKPAALYVSRYARTAISAFLRGGPISGLTLSQIQAMNLAVSITVDGVVKSGTVNLATASSYSSAAQIIGSALSIQGAQGATLTGTISGTTLTVSALASGTLVPGQLLSGTGVTGGTYVTAQLTGTTGSTGTYTVTASQTAASESITAYAPGVTYDSVSGALTFNSATTGTGSTITYASGSLASSLFLTQGSGAVISQGAAADTPAGAMDAITDITLNWASFMTTWEPSEADKEAFATWSNGQNNRFVYEMWDTNAVNETASGPSTAIGVVIDGDFSGVDVIHEVPGLNLFGGEFAAFEMGCTASINFTQTNGRITFAFRRQTGLTPQITNGTKAAYLIANGNNFYGDYTTANQAFKWWQPGSISGPFLWKDSYVDQIWLNNQLQLALMVLLDNALTIPYNRFGYSLIEAACLDTINQALDFGAIRPGVTLSEAQKVEVNADAGVTIDKTLKERGWYLQVKDALPQVRAARGSPPINFFYMDGGSVQKLVIASIEIQ